MFVHAGLVLSIMVLAFIVAKWAKVTTELSMAIAALAGALFHTKGIPSDISLRVPLPTLTFA